MAFEGQQNAGGQRRTDDNGKPYYDPAPLSEYPRMMYRATEVEQTQPFADEIAELKDKPMVINRFNGLLCETTIAHSADEAEVLATNGWDVTPEAAHGVVTGMAAAATAKDDRIAELEAMLAARDAEPASEEPRRGPGRPPKQPVDATPT
jgi:uncharacterized membrane protein